MGNLHQYLFNIIQVYYTDDGINLYKIAIKKNRFILKTTIHSKTEPRGNLSISDEQFEYQFSLSQTFKKFYFNPISKR